MTSNIGPSFDPARIDAIRASLDKTSTSRAKTPPSKTPTEPGRKPLWITALTLIVSFTLLLYAIEMLDTVLNHRLDGAGVEPREADGLWGILFAPLLHYGWGHLLANTVPMLVLGFLSLMAGIARGIAATAIVWVVGGFGTWLTGSSGSVHIGASVLIFGWLTFLIVRGVFNRSAVQILIGLVVLAVYGGLLWGVLPSDPRVSWQGHLFGAIGGLIAAWMLSSSRRSDRRKPAVAV
ncbi:MAG: rhomboid family intramembrane serine protease [Rhodococcus fascians]